MQITVIKLLELKNALQSLDQFKFDSRTTYTLTRDLDWILSEIGSVEKTRKKLHEDSGSPEAPKTQTDPQSPEYAKFSVKWEEFLSTEIEIKDLRRINYNTLNIGSNTDKKENQIPIRVLSALLPIIDGPEEV